MKLHRLLGITMLLLGRKRMSGQELADRFEVSLRTIYRDLETINSAGIPIASYPGADGGYEIMDQYRIDRQMVSLDELHSIVTALKGMQTSLDDRDMDHLLAKVGALVAKSEQNRMDEAGETIIFETNMWQAGLTDKTMITQLRQAAKNRNVVRFAYMNKKGLEAERTVEPIGLAWKGVAWYLYGYCRLRDDYRIFKLSRMKGLHVQNENFPTRAARLEDLNAQWGSWQSSSYIKILLRFQPQVRMRVEEYFRPEQIAVQEDGSLIVTSDHLENSWLYGMLFSYGTDVQVLEPEHLVKNYREQAEQIARLYQ